MSDLEQIILTGNKSIQLSVSGGDHKTFLLCYGDAETVDAELAIDLAKDASCTIYHLQNSVLETVRNQIKVTQAQNSNLTLTDVALGGTNAHSTINVELNGEYAHCDVFGLVVGDNDQQLNHCITVHHNAAHTTSNQNYRGLANDQAKGHIASRVVVAQGAQKIASTQSSKNILLSKQASIQTKPELEIYADDVQCAHGATVGELDDDAIFYLCSRGIEKAHAIAMMTYAFVAEHIDGIANDAVQEQVRSLVLPKIPNSDQLRGGL